MALKTILSLVKESGELKNTTLSEKVAVFCTLSTLYFKSKFSKTSRVVSHSIAGYRVYAYDYYTLIFLYREIFLGQAYHFQSANDQPFIIDCGANIGMSVLYFKKIYPRSEIWAFEPNPDAFELLRKNVETNVLNGVRLFNCALSNIEKQEDFLIPAKKGALYASFSLKDASAHKIKVDTKKLSSFIRNRQIELLKMDIEGAEIQVIKELVDSHAIHKIKKFIIEFHVLSNSTGPEDFFIRYFKENGFEYQVRFNPYVEKGSKDVLLVMSNMALNK